MRKFLVFLLVLILLAGGAYGYFWYMKSNEFKDMVTKDIEQINTGAAMFVGGDKKLISYSGMSVSGFPLNITLKIENPTFTVPVNKIIELANAGATPPVPPAPPAMEEGAEAEQPAEDASEAAAPAAPVTPVAATTPWIEEHSVAGSIDLSVDLFATRFSLVTNGTRTGKSIINGEEKFSFTGSGGTTSCSLSLDKTSMMQIGMPWDFPKIREKIANEMDKIFESAGCATTGYQTANAKTNEVLMTMNGAEFNFALDRSNPEQISLSGLLRIADSKATPALDKFFAEFMEASKLADALKMPSSMLMPVPFSELGNQNMNFDFSLTFPKDTVTVDPKTVVFDLNVRALSLSNDLMKMSYPMQFSTTPSGDRRNLLAKIDSTATFTPKYDTYKRKEMEELADYLYESQKSSPEDMKDPWLKNLSKEQTRELILSFLPELAPLGDIKFTVNVTGDIKNDPMNYTESAKVDIGALDFITALFGFKTNGKLQFPGAGAMMPFPQGSVTIECLSCETLVTKGYAYAKAIEEAISKVDTNYGQRYVTDEKSAAILAFLKALAQPKGGEPVTGKDWTYALNATADGVMTINGHTPEDASALFNQHLAPIMTPPSDQPSSFEPESGHTEAPPATLDPSAGGKTIKKKSGKSK